MGYFVSAPDYLGLGDGKGLHPYLNAATEASASLDMLTAAREVARRLGLKLSPRLFVAGYSQGGHAALAVQREIEAQGSQIVASAAMDAPLDLAGAALAGNFDAPSEMSSFYAAYLLLSMNSVYGIVGSLSEAVQSPYDARLTQLFDGSRDAMAIVPSLPPRPDALYRADFIAAVRSGRNSYARRLRENSLIDWTPKAPVFLLHARGDRFVSFANSQAAFDSFTKRGVPVRLIDLGATYDHDSAAMPAFITSLQLFNALR